MTTVLVEKAMLETFIGEKSIVDKSVHIFQTLGKVVRTVQHAWKSSPHFFSTRENVFPFSAYIDSKGLYGIEEICPHPRPRGEIFGQGNSLAKSGPDRNEAVKSLQK